MKQLHNLKIQKDRRRELRKNLTPAEAFLWRQLSGSKLDGRKFRRHHGIGPYIVDFYCPDCRVIVELDGADHQEFLVVERDERRTRFFMRHGIKVVRFENKEVFEDLESVLEVIRLALRD